MMNDSRGMWFCQTLTDDDRIYGRVSQYLAAGATAYQRYQVWQSPTLGRCVSIDGDLQSSELDRATYHEALVHPAMLLHPQPRTVLICGGGEGATAREVLRHGAVERVVMVDIDGEFTAACREYLPEWSDGAFADARLEVRHEDIFDYVVDNQSRFDVIIGDLTDLIEEIAPGKSFHGMAFYRALRGLLTPGGVLATQASALALFDYQRHAHIRNVLRQVFAHSYSYRAAHDSFFVPWSFVLASDVALPAPPELIGHFAVEVERRGLSLTHFDAPSLAACFLLERRIRERIGEG